MLHEVAPRNVLHGDNFIYIYIETYLQHTLASRTTLHTALLDLALCLRSQVIEMLGRENVKISAKQMADITKLLESEQKVEEDIQKARQEKRAAEENGEKRGEDK